jgi:hypothetical protein
MSRNLGAAWDLLLGLIFRFSIYRGKKLTGRADGFFIGAQASGDARALRHPVGV